MADTSPIPPRHRPAEGGMHRITLRHGAHRWTFRFTTEDARVMIKHAARLARDPEAPFDWFDASVVCHQIARAQADTPSPQHGSGGPDRVS
jgi:hypothetical protein